MKKFFLIATIFFAVLTSSILFLNSQRIAPFPKQLNQTDTSRQSKSQDIITHELPVREVSGQTKGIESYILKYDTQNLRVILITNYSDGTNIISDVDSINPQYLESADIKALSEGIEVNSKEDMYLLIEDYSS